MPSDRRALIDDLLAELDRTGDLHYRAHHLVLLDRHGDELATAWRDPADDLESLRRLTADLGATLVGERRAA